MDGSLDPADLFRVAAQACAAALILRLIFLPRAAPRPTPSALIPAPRADDDDGVIDADQHRSAATLRGRPGPVGSTLPGTAVTDVTNTPGADPGNRSGLPPVTLLLVADDAHGLVAAQRAADRHCIFLLDQAAFPAPQAPAARASSTSPWPSAHLIVVGNTTRQARETALQRATVARVPLLLAARQAASPP